MNHDRHASMNHIGCQNMILLFRISICADIQPGAYTDYNYISFIKSRLQESPTSKLFTDPSLHLV